MYSVFDFKRPTFFINYRDVRIKKTDKNCSGSTYLTVLGKGTITQSELFYERYKSERFHYVRFKRTSTLTCSLIVQYSTQ